MRPSITAVRAAQARPRTTTTTTTMTTTTMAALAVRSVASCAFPAVPTRAAATSLHPSLPFWSFSSPLASSSSSSSSPPPSSSSRRRPYQQQRAFSTSPRCSARVDHYGTLKLPRNASRQQIKARFYELSKKHHPDAPGGSSEAFHAINDAYHVLGDPDARAAYDRSSTPASQRGTSGSFYPHSPEARRGASGPHRAWGGKPPPGAHWTGHRRFDPDMGKGMGMGAGPMPRNVKWGRKAGHGLGAAAAQRERENRLDHEVSGESVLWRTVVIAVLLTAIVGLAGRLTASAETMPEAPEDEEDESGDEVAGVE